MHKRLDLLVSIFPGLLVIFGIMLINDTALLATLDKILVVFFPFLIFLFISSIPKSRKFAICYSPGLLALVISVIQCSEICSKISLELQITPAIRELLLILEGTLVVLLRMIIISDQIENSLIHRFIMSFFIIHLILCFFPLNNRYVLSINLLSHFLFWFFLYHSVAISVQQAKYPITTSYSTTVSQSSESTIGISFHQRIFDMLINEGTGDLYHTIVSSAKSLLCAEFSLLGLYDHKRKIITLKPNGNDHEQTECLINCQRIMDTVSLSHHPLIIDSNHHASHYFLSPGECNQSYIAVPLLTQGSMFGVLTVCNINTGKTFTEADLEICMLFGTYAAIIIRNDQLLKDTLHRAQTDFLTGLYNYRHLIEVAYTEISRAQRYNHSLTALMFDVDHFKVINDTYGHSAGDLVLSSIANLCRQLFRNVDIVCRYGGEEFFVLLPETPVETAKDVAERLKSSVQTMVTVYHRHPISVTISLGISCLSSSCTTINRLIERADTALYCAKKEGRNRICVWNPTMSSICIK